MDEVEFRLLGPLEALDGDRRLPLGGGQQRALLALLLLEANRVVPAERLVDELWPEGPPQTAATAVQVYVSRLRKALGPAAIATRGRGYVVEVEDGRLDLQRFEALAAAGRRALAEGDAERAATLLRDALAEWRGPPLADLAGEAAAAPAIARLEALRVSAIEDRAEADLALGRHAELAEELEALVAGNPHRERLRAQLMLALYRAGRQAEALAVYREGRRALVEELGIEPGPALQRLEQAILVHDPSLDPEPARMDATVIFADLGVAAPADDATRARDFLARASAEAAGAVAALGGTIQEGIAGAVLATFAGEDHVARALAAALALRDRLDPLGHPRLALATGEVLAGARADGGAFVTGPPVGAAALLVREAAAGEIVVGEEVAEAAGARFEVRARPGSPGRLLVRAGG
ncbi:MAG TPA: AfsR/SARP family transcriptional regulator [Gaiellaceae bacterium]|nr:AfsR/SARP family transcriptional regulator [Gaiellaceae bacterium]